MTKEALQTVLQMVSDLCATKPCDCGCPKKQIAVKVNPSHSWMVANEIRRYIEKELVKEKTWKVERLDHHEIRVTSPEGESWRLHYADLQDGFNSFIWRWAESMLPSSAWCASAGAGAMGVRDADR